MRRFVDESQSDGNEAVADELLAHIFRNHRAARDVPGQAISEGLPRGAVRQTGLDVHACFRALVPSCARASVHTCECAAMHGAWMSTPRDLRSRR